MHYINKLEINKLFCKVRIYDYEDSIIQDLIETNIRQRGDISSSSLKMGRIICELERIYGIRQGSAGKSNPQVADVKSQSNIAEQLGMSVVVKHYCNTLTTTSTADLL
jgi:hypothetical protein